jgi:hypothetical protein
MKNMSKDSDDNRSNQMNPNNDAYYQSRGYDSKDDYDDSQNTMDDDYDDHEEEDEYIEEDEDSYDPEEEPAEYADMPGDTPDEREEYYDNNY